MIIKILGSGCSNCLTLEKNAKRAVDELNLKDVKVEHIYDINKIVEYGVINTPAIVFNNDVKASGRIPGVEEIRNWLKEL